MEEENDNYDFYSLPLFNIHSSHRTRLKRNRNTEDGNGNGRLNRSPRRNSINIIDELLLTSTSHSQTQESTANMNMNRKRRNSEPHVNYIHEMTIEHLFETPTKKQKEKREGVVVRLKERNCLSLQTKNDDDDEREEVHEESEKMKIAFDYSSEIVKENILLNEEIRLLKEKMYSGKDKKILQIRKLKEKNEKLKSEKDECYKEIRKLKIENEKKCTGFNDQVTHESESFRKLKREVSFLNNNGDDENEGDLSMKYELLKKEMEIIEKEKNEFRKYFKVMSKKNKKCKKMIVRLKNTIHSIKGDKNWGEKGIQLKKKEDLQRTESDEMLCQRIKIDPRRRKLSNVLSDSNIKIAIKNSRKEMSFERVKGIREELANLKNIIFLLLSNINHMINENQVFHEKFRNILPKLSDLSLLANKNKWEYSQIQMKIIEDLGLLDLYNKNNIDLSPAKEGFLAQKHMIGWKKVYVSIIAKQNSLSVYSTQKKQKLLQRESLHGTEIIEGNVIFEFGIKFANSKRLIYFRCGKTCERMQWVGFLDSLFKMNLK